MGSFVLSAGAAAAVLALIRLRAPGWVLVALGCAPVVALYALADVRAISFHGFFHTSIVQRILAGGIPPSDPLFAEQLLLYPWAHHLWVALALRWTGLPPATGFAILNALALAATLIAVFAIARDAFRDRTTAIFAGLLSVYGLAAVPVALALGPTGIELESRLIPVQKFANTNSNGLGIAAFAVGLLATWRILETRDRNPVAGLVLLFGSVLAAAWLYPLVWAPFVAAVGAGVVVAQLRTEAPRWGTTLRILGVLAGASAIALPYLLGIQLGKSPQAAIALDLSGAHLLRAAANLVLVVLGWLVLIGFARVDLRARLAAQPAAWTVLAMAAVIPALLFAAVHAAIHSEYKFLMLTGFVLAIPAASAVARLYSQTALGCFALLWLLLWPAGSYFSQMAARDFRGGHAAVGERDGRLVIGDADEAALLDWIRTATPPDAVFVDTALSIPPFAHRALYVAFDAPAHDRDRAGWGLSASEFLLDVVGHAPERIDARRSNAVRALAGDTSAWAALRTALQSEHVYLVARGEATRVDGLEPVFTNGSIRVYRVPEISAAMRAGPSMGTGP